MKSALSKTTVLIAAIVGLVRLMVALPSFDSPRPSTSIAPPLAEQSLTPARTSIVVDRTVVHQHNRVPMAIADAPDFGEAPSGALPELPNRDTRTLEPQQPAAVEQAGPGYNKLDSTLRVVVSGDAGANLRVIVQSRPGRHLETRALVQQAGGSVRRVSALDGSIVADMSAESVRWMAQQSSTWRLSTDARVEATQASYTDGIRLRTSMGLKKGGRLMNGSGHFEGDKVVVAVIDSGIEPSKDLERKRIVAFFDFTRTGRAESVEPYDDHGHGARGRPHRRRWQPLG